LIDPNRKGDAQVDLIETKPVLPESRDAMDASLAKSSKGWMTYAGMGMELASYTLALTALGYAIDQMRGHETPFGTAFGTLIGFSFGMFRFIQRASRA